MDRVIKTGLGWRIGWNPNAEEFKGLLGGQDWAIELKEAELDDFCRLLRHLSQTISQIAAELMDEETIACEAETDLIWMEVAGLPSAYGLRFILNTGRCVEGNFPCEAIPGLIAATQTLKVF